MWHVPHALNDHLKQISEKRKNPKGGEDNEDEQEYDGGSAHLPPAWRRAQARVRRTRK